jgi:iron complex outermembrane receptor protein
MNMSSRSSISNLFKVTLLGSCAIALCGVDAVRAQDAAVGLEMIEVTARKRVENLQTLSGAGSALSAGELNRRFDSDVRDFASASPNVVIDDTNQGPGGVASVYIRGIGVSEVEKSIDPAVGVVFDDIYIGQTSGSLFKAIDIDRVEVMRGPQGSLFGRNATGGIIILGRSKPTEELTGRARVTYGRFNTFKAEGVTSFGLMDNLALKLTGAYESTDGYMYNVTQQEDGQKSDFRAIGAQFLLTPTEDLEISLGYDYQKTRQDAPQMLSVPRDTDLFCVVYEQCSPAPGVPTSGDPYKSLSDGPINKDAWFEMDLAIGKVKYDLSDDFELLYIFGYMKTDEGAHHDWDGSAMLLYHTDRPARWRQITNEVRLTKGGSGPLNFVLGGYHWDSKYTINLKNYIGFAGPALQTSHQDVTQTTDSYAVFFEGDYKITEDLKFTVGARYTHDRKTSIVNDGLLYIYDEPFEGVPVDVIEPSLEAGNILMDAPVKESWSKFTPKVSLSYNWDEDFMTYALWSRGYRGGGFNGRPGTLNAAIIPYGPETVDNFEIGMKSEFLDNRLRVNASAFLMKYKDMQQDLDVPAPGTSTGRENRTINASKADLKGVELDFAAIPVVNLTIHGNVGYLKAKYKDFFGDIYNTGTPVDATFLKIRRSPKWTWTLGGTYEFEVGPGEAWISGMVHYIGKHEVTFLNNPNISNGGQYMVDASVNYRINETTISVFGKNLANEKGWTIGYDVQHVWSYATARPPRMWGVALTQNF